MLCEPSRCSEKVALVRGSWTKLPRDVHDAVGPVQALEEVREPIYLRFFHV